MLWEICEPVEIHSVMSSLTTHTPVTLPCLDLERGVQ